MLQVLVVRRDRRVFLRRTIVELVWLNADVAGLLHLNLEHGSVNDGFVHQVLLLVTMKGSSALRQFLTFVGEELLLVVQTVGDIAIIATFILDHTIEEVLIFSLRGTLRELVLEGGILLESLSALIVVTDDLLWRKDTDGTLRNIELHHRLGISEVRSVSHLTTVVHLHCVCYGLQGEAALDRGDWVQAAIVTVTY